MSEDRGKKDFEFNISLSNTGIDMSLRISKKLAGEIAQEWEKKRKEREAEFMSRLNTLRKEYERGTGTGEP